MDTSASFEEQLVAAADMGSAASSGRVVDSVSARSNRAASTGSTAEPMSAAEIVELLLHGIGKGRRRC